MFNLDASVGIVIPVYGSWDQGMLDRAVGSAVNQTVPTSVIVSVQDTLHEARNTGAKELSLGIPNLRWFVFLDADDELHPQFVEKMLEGYGDIRQPMTMGIEDNVVNPDEVPVFIPPRPLSSGNFIVIGALVNAEKFLSVGGFDDYPIYEDWALWMKMVNAGSLLGRGEGVYIAHFDTGRAGRNSSMTQQEREYWLQTIRTIYNL